MDPLTPNTSAFISYLSSAMEQEDNVPKSFPPSAFFPMPVPGRDTPENTPPSSNEQSRSPEQRAQADQSVSDESHDDSPREHGGGRESEQGIHKRKAGRTTRLVEEDEDDDGESSRPDHTDRSRLRL